MPCAGWIVQHLGSGSLSQDAWGKAKAVPLMRCHWKSWGNELARRGLHPSHRVRPDSVVFGTRARYHKEVVRQRVTKNETDPSRPPTSRSRL